VEDGLSNNKINCILKDKKGFMWFGTDIGLNRYDGKSIKIYKHDPDDSTSISHNQIQAIYQDQDEIIWICTYGGGLNKYNPATDRFTHFKHDPNDSMSISNDFLLSICGGKSGDLWIGTNGTGIEKYDKKRGIFTNYAPKQGDSNSISHGIVRAIHEDAAGIIWVGTSGGGLDRCNPKTGRFTHFKNESENKKSLNNNYIQSITEDNSGTLWIAAGGLNRFDKANGIFYRYFQNPKDPQNLIGNEVTSLFISLIKQDLLWVATLGGVIKFDIEKNIPVHFKHIADDQNTINTNQTRFVYEDEQGFLWIGTDDRGVNVSVNKPDKIRRYFHEPGNENSLSSSNMSSIFEDGSEILWFGTDWNGLNSYDRKTQKFEHYVSEPNNPYSISSNEVRCIIEEKKGILWIGTYSGLNRFDTRAKKFTRYYYEPLVPASLPNNSIFTLCFNREGNLLVGSIEGGLLLFKYNPDGESSFQQFKHDPADPTSISDNSVLALYEDTMGNIWVGTMIGGLNKFEIEKKQFIRYEHDPDNPYSISNNCVNSIYEDSRGTLWLGTFGGGLNKFNPTTEKFTHYRQKNGLANDVIIGILEDNENYLWMSTRNGLSRFNPAEVDADGNVRQTAFSNFYTEDGLTRNEFNYSSYYKAKDGEMFFGTPEGLNSFYPQILEKNIHIPPVFITDFKVFNEPYPLDTAITDIKDIILSYHENFLSFEFAALDYFNPKKNKYVYTMEGIDPGWVQTTADRSFASYTDLAPGSYVFRVNGSNNDGKWNEQGASLHITILPPWWRTNWAYAFYILFIALSFYVMRFYDRKRQQLKHDLELEHLQSEKLKEIDHLKSRFFANISHEFRTPLTLITGPVERLLNQVKGKKVKDDLIRIKNNARRMNNLVEMYLDLSRLESGKLSLQKKEIDIIPVVKYIVTSFKSMAESNQLEITITTSISSAICNVDKEKFELVLINLLSNAIKFTPPHGSIHISVDTAPGNKNLSLCVRDTGIGIPMDQLERIFDMYYQVENDINKRVSGTGIGLTMVKELVKMHAGEIITESTVGKGSAFTITIPTISVNKISGNKIHQSVYKTKERKGIANAIKINPKKRNQQLILIVEDDDQMSDYINSHVKIRYMTKIANNGQQGFESALLYNPVLIISDVMMPGMDGFELCKKLKNDFRTSHIPIILLTAKTEEPDLLKGLAIGADNYLKKPFKANELVARITNLIANRERLHKKFKTGQRMDLIEFNITPADESFLEKCLHLLENRISNPDYSVNKFASELALSRVQLHRKLKALTGMSTNQYINMIRLKKAVAMLDSGLRNISEISYDCGFSNPSYFTELFKQIYKFTPTQYRQKSKM